jgi:hypothetical protein
MLLRSTGARRVKRVGLGSAFVLAILVFAGSTSAMAHELSLVYRDQNGHFSVPLTSGEIPGGGDPGGQGSAELTLSTQQQTACFSINWKGLKEQVTAFHLHAAGAGSEGPHWIDFFNDQRFPGADGKSSGCVPTTADKIGAVIGNPAAYYLNVPSTAFPKGALRGQLR